MKISMAYEGYSGKEIYEALINKDVKICASSDPDIFIFCDISFNEFQKVWSIKDCKGHMTRQRLKGTSSISACFKHLITVS